MMRYVDNISFHLTIDPDTFGSKSSPDLADVLNRQPFASRRIINAQAASTHWFIVSEDIR